MNVWTGGGGTMSELSGLGFLFVARAKDEGLSDEEILWMVDGQIQRLEVIENGME
jgi:hypothetical protein